MLTALLFDLDGTMVDSDPIHFQTWQKVLSEYGLEIDSKFYRTRFSGKLNAQIIQDLLPQLSPEEGQALSARKEAEFRKLAETLLTPLPGLLELVVWAKAQGLKQGVVTNAPRENAEFMLKVLGIKDTFAAVVLGEDLPKGKPDPMPYQVAMNLLETSPETTLAFEDSPSGMRSAVSAGIPTVGLASTQLPETLYELGATLVTSDFVDSQLQELLRLAQSTTLKKPPLRTSN
ncbi:MAG: HAD-IA family hydrolase [Leptolyngbyaceae cyanobacterium RM2_2_4]|nr:HAD-IA family hydrolase [Leptolyngbyaceae cyanobacterium SM1_4_3]NJN89120.1 HAD-IA family hydrolase [Leptolyngbyaceae cyanobacterium SL_5_14]NJO49656.1 HAD-IA family hydrolase [Leptolyngbyaceae cyanobacterium RM2_2_4]NJO66293.1 HAD-IA family hydrolase [Leptolyngbyaceae cyanobacterium RM1_405_57]